MKFFKIESVTQYFGLFASFSTLMCCGLPSLFVAIGLGATVASSVAVVPQLTWFGKNSTLVFVFAGLMLAINGFIIWKNRNKPCDITAKTCGTARKVSIRIFVVSVAVYIVGFVTKVWYLF